MAASRSTAFRCFRRSPNGSGRSSTSTTSPSRAARLAETIRWAMRRRVTGPSPTASLDLTMPDAPTDPKGFSLRRWSQRKHAAARGNLASDRAPGSTAAPVGTALPDPTSPVPTDASAGSAAAIPSAATGVVPTPSGTASTTAVTGSASGAAVPLPSLESLTIDSDYSPFMQPGVDDAMKRGALKKLFSDPRFNVMDGLDVYIDDYSKPDPLDPAIVRTLAQARYIFNPPATRVTAEGHVEDIPEEELRAAARDAGSEAAAGPDAEGQDVAAV